MKQNKEFQASPLNINNITTKVSQNMCWSIKKTNIPKTWEITKGEGMLAVVIDTGYPIHKDIGDNAIDGSSCIPGVNSIDRNGHSCVTADTNIFTTFCGLENIETLYNNIDSQNIFIDKDSIVKDISDKDIYTISFDGESFSKHKITAVHKIRYNGDLLKLTYGPNKSDPLSISLTPWHPLYIMKSRGEQKNIKKIEASKINIGDNLIRNDVCFTPNEEYRNIEYSYNISDNSGGFYINENKSYTPPNKNRKEIFEIIKTYPGITRKDICYKLNKARQNIIRPINDLLEDNIIIQKIQESGTVTLNEDLAWFIGFLLTDGHLYNDGKNYRVEVSQVEKNIEALYKMEKILKNLNINYTIHKIKNNQTHLYFNNKKWWNVLTTIMPYKNKTYKNDIPKLITKSPLSVCMAFLAGCIDGDGYVSKTDGRIKITSASRIFVERLRLWLMTLGFPNVSIIKNKHKSGFGGNATTWNIKFRNSSNMLYDHISITRKKENLSKGQYMTHRVQKVSDIENVKYNGYLYDFTVEGATNYIANGIIASNTHVTGIICAKDNDFGVVGVAPKSKVENIKALNDDGSGNYDWVNKALDYAIKIRPNVVCMSMGAPAGNRKLHNKIKKLYNMDIPVVVAAGNNGRNNGVEYPAKYKETIAVGAYDASGKLARFSSKGSEVDFVAPGVDIYSTYLNNSYVKLNGTSMATPWLCGVILLLLAKHKKQEEETGKNDCKTVEQIREHLIKYTVDKGITGRDNKYGYGLVDVVKLLDGDESPIVTPETIKRNSTVSSRFARMLNKLLDLFKR